MSGFKASRKIGVKLLDPIQLENTFPQYNDLMRNIELQRERADVQSNGYHNKKLIEHEHYLMHDNIFSLFGGRGSGKTSVLFSLREILLQQGEKKGDIVLPVIMPEIINNECTLLGWVLAMFGDVVGEIEGEIKKEARLYSQEFARGADIDFFENCRFNNQNRLREEYNLIYRECFSDTSVIAGQYSYADALNIKADQSRRQYQLIKRLNRFWNLLVDTKYQMEEIRIKKEGGSYKVPRPRPLIFIMFDDIDLAPERSMELLTSAFKCFSNPNVVIIISAAMKTLQHVLLCKMYEKVVGSHFSSLLQDPTACREAAELYEIEEAKRAAEEYLNKVIPPSSRFFLERYDSCSQKLLFRYSREWENSHYDPLCISSKPIAELLTELVDDFGGSTEQNFLLSRRNGPDSSSFVTAYLLMFGSKNRYVFNGCLVIINTLEKLKGIKEKKGEAPYTVNAQREIYFVLKHLLSVLVASNEHRVIDYRQDLEGFLILGKNEWDLYINYALLLEIYEKESFAIKSRVTPKYEGHHSEERLHNQEFKEQLVKIKRSVGALFVTLFFVENLLRVMLPARGAIHGYREIIEFLNKDTTVEDGGKDSYKPIQLFQNKKWVEDILEDYVLVLENPKAFIALDLFNYADIHNYFVNAYADKWQKEELEPEQLAESCKSDFKWSKTALALLFTYQSGLLLVNKEYHHRYDLLLDSLIWWEYEDIISERIDQAFKYFLGQNNIRDYSVKKTEQFWTMVNKYKAPVLRESQLAEMGKIQDLEELFRQIDKERGKESLLQKQCYKLWKDFNQRYDSLGKTQKTEPQDFNQRIVFFIEAIIDWVRAALFFNNFVVRVDISDLSDISRSIEELMETSPAAQEKGRRILEQLDKEREDFPDWRFMKFEDFFPFMVEVRNTFKHFNADIISYYISYIQDLVEGCFVYEAAGGEKSEQIEKGKFSMADLVLNLHLLYYLAPFYFAAQFIVADSRRNDTWELRARSEQGEAQGNRFAAVYKKIVQYVEKPENRSHMLAQTFQQAKNEVVEDYRQKIED